MRFLLTTSLMLLPASIVGGSHEAFAAPPSESITVAPKVRAARPNMRVNLPEFDLNSYDFNFPSGLRVLFQPDNSYPIVSVMSVVDHGSTDDPVGKEGIAHFVEHAWFRSQHGDLPPIMEVIQDLGCAFNATTRNDWTDYRSVCSSDKIDILMKLESLRLTDTVRAVTEEQIDVEREVVRNELRMRMENGGGEMFRYINKHLYPEGHPYARMTIGTHGSLDNIKLADIAKFTEDYYRADTTTLMVVGDIATDPKETLSYVFANFEPSLLHPDLTEEHIIRYPRDAYMEDPKNPGMSLAGTPFVEPDENVSTHWLYGAVDPANPDQLLDVQMPPKIRIQRGDLPEPPPLGDAEPGIYDAPVDDRMALAAWSLPPGFRGHDVNFQMMSFVANYAVSNGLRGEYGVGGAGCFYQPGRDGSSLLCYAELQNSKIDGVRIAEKITDQMATIYNMEMQPIFQRDFSRAKMQFLSQTLGSLDTISAVFGGRAEDIVVPTHLTGTVQAHSAQMNDTMTANAAVVAQYAEKYLKRKRAALVVLNPIPDDDIETDNSESNYHGAQRGDDVTLADDLSAVTEEMIEAEAIKPDFSQLRDVRLANGMRIVVMPQGEAPLMQATLVIGGGNAHGGPLGMMATGFNPVPNYPGYGANVGVFKAGAIQDALSFAGTMGGSGGTTNEYVFISGPSGNISSAFWSMREHIDTMKPDLAGKADFARNGRSGLKRSWRSVNAWINRIRNEHLFGDHVLGYSPDWDDYDVMKGAKTSDIDALLKRRWQPSNATLLVAGPVNADEVIAQANEHFGNWRAAPGVETGPIALPGEVTVEREPRVVLFEDEGSTQTNVNLFCPLQKIESPEDEAARQVLAKMLSDQNFLTLRVKHGVTYGAYAGSQSYANGFGFLVMNSLSVNVGAPLTVNTFMELARNAENGEFDENLIKQAKLRLVRSFGVSAQSASQVSNMLMKPITWNMDWSFVEDAPKALAGVDGPRMKRLMQGCADQALITMVGDSDTVGPMLDEAGIEYELFDWSDEADQLLLQHDPKAYKKLMKDRAKREEKQAKADEEGDVGNEE